MLWHIGSFTSFAIANIIWTTIQAINASSLKIETKIGLVLTLSSESLTVVCVVFSELPLLHIINSLVYFGYKDQAGNRTSTFTTILETQ
jgi:hypothetical protein